MLELKNIVKNYQTGTDVVRALKGVSINFRESEFVAILGHSGCGKTTLLNIVGGLDKYTDGDLIINGVSTKKYTDRDWDKYRNHSIGFVFQSYNLIPHQTVLENVELALTLSGVGVEERRKRAFNALSKVGLSDQVKKRPNQLSGGQVQRVAIARALVNNPDIILADEPTGALDSDTSVQIMDILKEISKEKLVIMVTHNPELASTYATRTIRLKDGLITGDDNPYDIEKEKKVEENKVKKPIKKFKNSHSMSFLTAVKLSFKNLFTKKGRTVLTSFAGSIGIIGIALILSLSTGFNNYIDTVQKDTLSNYPLTIQENTNDMTSILTGSMNSNSNGVEYPDGQTVVGKDALAELYSSITQSVYKNNLKDFKSYLDVQFEKEENKRFISAIQYSYNLNISWYKNGVEVNDLSMIPSESSMASMSAMVDTDVFAEMIDNQELLNSQYEVLKGRWPSGENKAYEAVLVVDKYNSLTDYQLFNIGLDAKKLEYYVLNTSLLALNNTPEKASQLLEKYGYNKNPAQSSYTFDELLNLEYQVLTSADYFYKKQGDQLYSNIALKKYKQVGSTKTLNNRTTQALQRIITGETPFGNPNATNEDFIDKDLKSFVSSALSDGGLATKVKIVGVVRQRKDVTSGALSGTICYTKDLTEKLIEKTQSSSVYLAQKQSSSNVVDGQDTTEYLTESQRIALAEENFGVINKNNPTQIAIYPTSFDNKDAVTKLIDDYNLDKTELTKIKYTDYLGIMMSSITIIINAISYVLIAFVSISLVVSSIMIGIITYISVLERTKEIGVLRSLGASKKDISRVFNAETLIIGLASGIIGVVLTVILNIPITLIVQGLAEISAVASLPIGGAIVLVLISMSLTLIAGLIPSRVAANKDPVIALRTE